MDYSRLVPLGYGQVTDLSAAVGLPTVGSPAAIPPTADVAIITAETQDVRYRDDGTAPTASVGQPLAKGTALIYTGSLSAIQFIQQTASAKLNVSYYKNAG